MTLKRLLERRTFAFFESSPLEMASPPLTSVDICTELNPAVFDVSSGRVRIYCDRFAAASVRFEMTGISMKLAILPGEEFKYKVKKRAHREF